MIDSALRAGISGMPLATLDTHRLEQFIVGPKQQKAYQACLKFIGSKDGQPLREHHFLTIGGEKGRGKTHLALGIGWWWLANTKGTVAYWQVEVFLDALRAGYDGKASDDQRYAFEFTKCASLLILDDLGAEKATEWAMAKLDEVVDYRYINGRPLVVATNLALSQLPPRIASRLSEGVTVLVEGPDFREYKARVRKAP